MSLSTVAMEDLFALMNLRMGNRMPPNTSLERTANRQAHAWREQKVGFFRFENKRGRLADRFFWATPEALE
jgi:hypothetical protein